MTKKIRRKLYITTEISDESYTKFSKRLTMLESRGSGPIEVELFSAGGDAYAALAFSARMRASPCVIRIHARGLIASAAVLILAAGDIREMAKEAWVMVHEDSGENSGNVSELMKQALHMEALEDQWAVLLEERSSTSAEAWRKLHNETKYLTSSQCLALGLIDKIV